jgi:hypothetical protein
MAEFKMTVSARDVPEVRAELERLRAIIKTAEWADGTHDVDGCPWCAGSRDDGSVHTPRCPAFTPEGEVR